MSPLSLRTEEEEEGGGRKFLEVFQPAGTFRALKFSNPIQEIQNGIKGKPGDQDMVLPLGSRGRYIYIRAAVS